MIFFLIVVDCRLRRRHCRLSRFTLFIFYLLLLFPSTRLLIYLFIFFFYAYFFFSLFMYSRYIHAARNLSLEFFIFIYIFVRHYISRLSIQRPQIEALLVFQSQRLKSDDRFRFSFFRFLIVVIIGENCSIRRHLPFAPLETIWCV